MSAVVDLFQHSQFFHANFCTSARVASQDFFCRYGEPEKWYEKGYPALPEDEFAGTFDIVLANILAGVLFRLPPTLFKALKPGGKLLLSGMMKFQIQRLLDSYRDMFDVRVVVSVYRLAW